MKKTKTKCYLYTRVSTSMQVDGYSLEGQKNSLKRFADREEMEIVGIYEDAGKSGKSIEGYGLEGTSQGNGRPKQYATNGI